MRRVDRVNVDAFFRNDIEGANDIAHMNQHIGTSAGTDAEAQAEFFRYGYAVVPQLTEPALTRFLFNYIHTKFASGLMHWGDGLVPNTPASYGDPATDGLLAHVKERIEGIVGRALLPTYSYLRLYKTGDDLRSHRDRPACEFSISLNIGQTPDTPWPIFVESEGGWREVRLKPGDALLYRGMELWHRRERYKGRQCLQVFLHFVDANGPHAGEKFDGRASLMLPKPVPVRRPV